MSLLSMLANILQTSKSRLIWVYILVLIGAAFEMMSIGVLIPVGGLLLAGGEEIAIGPFQFELNSDLYSIIIFSVVIVYALKIIYMVLMYRKVYGFVYDGYKRGADLLFQNHIRAAIEKIEERSQEEVINSITYTLYYCYHGFLLPLVNLIVELTVVIFIFAFMLFIKPEMAVAILILVIIVALILKLLIGEKLVTKGRIQRSSQESIVGMVNSAIAGIKELKSTGAESYIEDKFMSSTSDFCGASRTIHLYRQLPRYVVEALIVGLLVLIVVVGVGSDNSEFLSVLPVFLIGAIRIAPSLNKIVSNYSSIKTYKETAFLLHQEFNAGRFCAEGHISTGKPLNISWNQIELSGLSYHYDNDIKVLKDIDLVIRRGDKIVITGESGCGKSTFLEVLSGVRQLKGGTVLIDNFAVDIQSQEWKKMVGYATQFPFIFDGSILENILLSPADQLDEKRLNNALKGAKVSVFASNVMKNLKSSGKNLSGGQAQRIGIARAMYNCNSLILLDEFTASLDQENTNAIVADILMDKNLTVVAVTHDQNVAKLFDRVYRMENGVLNEGK